MLRPTFSLCLATLACVAVGQERPEPVPGVVISEVMPAPIGRVFDDGPRGLAKPERRHPLQHALAHRAGQHAFHLVLSKPNQLAESLRLQHANVLTYSTTQMARSIACIRGERDVGYGSAHELFFSPITRTARATSTGCARPSPRPVVLQLLRLAEGFGGIEG